MTATMKAVQILGDVSSPKIATNYSMKIPIPQNDEILVQVHAAGITGDEIIWPEPYSTETRIPGHDISGVVYTTGPEYHGPLKVGQEVFALLKADRGQGQANYVVCVSDEASPKPNSISHDEAAALPIPLLTAWEALSEHGKVKAGMRVFITGASGAVGILATQIASQSLGAHVIALASSKNHETLKQLGAHEVFDYSTPNWEQHIRNVDVVFDTVGGDILAKTWEIVTDNGTIITVGDPAPAWAFGGGQAPESIDHPNVRYEHFIVSSNAEKMGKLSELIDEGSLKPLAVKSFPFHEAEKAWAYAQQRNRGQKAVINFTESGNALSEN
jgi:NADPH:quinone reductase-like Zn-dependent oxidoreductase